ncbi:hypothetical protein KAT95_03065 [Candidatus Parcubacteria bacterium]|nr:hypothetical protein [Candidatus Parcubacteria bacterium]
MPNNNLNKKQKLPVNTGDIIAELIKKHQLGPVDILDNPEMEKILKNAKTSEERLKIIKNLPFEKIFDIVEEITQGKTELKDLTPIIKKYLNLSGQKAKTLAEDLKKEIFTLSKKQIKPKEKIKEEPSLDKNSISIKKPQISSKKDVYRESIE